MQTKRTDCELKELVYDNVTLTDGQEQDKLYWLQDFELTNRTYNKMTLGTAKVPFSRDINMPWVKVFIRGQSTHK